MSDRFHWLRIVCLLLLAGSVQGWMVSRNRIPAQDAVTFVQIAREFDHEPIAETLRRNPQHPLFPVLIWSQHHMFAGLLDGGAATWLLTAQCVSAAAAVLLVVPMYFAGVRLANRDLATGATALFSVLPIAARLGADALSDSTCLLFLLCGFWTATEFLATRRPAWLFACGLAAGVGYLARPETLLLGAAVAITIVVLQLRAAWRCSWRTLAAAAGSFGLGLALAAAPYVCVTGKLTLKGSVILLPGGGALAATRTNDDDGILTAQLSDGRVVATRLEPLLAGGADATLEFGLKHRSASERFEGVVPAVRELTRELIEGMHYLFGLLVLVGITRSPRQPANLLATMLAVVFIGVLVAFASRAGYVSSRHVLVLVALGSYVAARGGWMLAGGLAHGSARLTRWASRAEAIVTPVSADALVRRQLGFAAALLIVSGVLCVPRNLLPLHPSREPHAQAGRWLAEHAPDGSLVLDSRGWAALYAGLPAYSFHGARIAAQDPRLAYVVIERSELDDAQPRGQTLRFLLSRAGENLAEFSVPEFRDAVLVYGWHAERLARAPQVERAATAN